MAGARKCCCDSCICPDGTKISSDGTVEWITHTVDSGVITVVDHEGPCITYWVNSTSGDVTETTGDGTEEHPWENINSVFADACIKYICTHQDSPDGCPKVKVLTKGTIDYTVDGGSYNYGRNLVFEPWDDATIEVSVSGAGVVTGVNSAVGVIWKNTNVEGESTDTFGYGFAFCTFSTFHTCTGVGTGASNTFLTMAGNGFYGCSSSTFNTCTGEGHTINSNYGNGFYGCSSSTFNTCTGEGTGTSGSYGGFGVGFQSCSSSTFNTCTGEGTGEGTYTGIGTNFGRGVGYGFKSCTFSTFHTCTGVGTGTGTSFSVGVGFDSCSSSTFTDCDGEGYATSVLVVCEWGCGFSHNTDSSFSGCTTTDKICNDCGSPCPSPNLDCDI